MNKNAHGMNETIKRFQDLVLGNINAVQLHELEAFTEYVKDSHDMSKLSRVSFMDWVEGSSGAEVVAMAKEYVPSFHAAMEMIGAISTESIIIDETRKAHYDNMAAQLKERAQINNGA